MISLFQETISPAEKLKDLVAVLLYLSFVVFSTNSAGVFYIVGLVLIVFLIHLYSRGFSLTFHIGMFHKYMLLLSVFCFVSGLWAVNQDMAIEKGVTLLEILLAFTLLYEAYYSSSINRLLAIIMWGGFILSIYTLLFVGIDNIQETLEEGDRLENTFANVNVIGMCCSTSVLIAYSFFQKRRNWLDVLMCIPCIIIIAGTGSRKAFLMLVVGLLFLALFRSNSGNRKSAAAKLFITILSVVIVIVLFLIISKLGWFEGTLERMNEMFASFTGKGEADSSSLIRKYYRYLGFQQLSQTPILGMGMGNARLLVQQYTGSDCYLHCNYAEIAAGGGVVGLLVVYWIYVVLLVKEIRFINKDDVSTIIVLLIILNLILDYARVSYYSKDFYFIMMVICLHYDKLSNRLPIACDDL